jgi:Domain of unknown function (DUF4402)
VGNRVPNVIVAFLGIAGLASVPVCAQSNSGQVNTVVVDRLSLVNAAPLDFGKLISGPTPGTAVISPTGVRSVTGGVLAAGGTPQAAEFAGYGARNQQVRIALPTGTTALKHTDGITTMNVTNLTIGAAVADGLTQIALGSAPPPRFRITSTTGLFTFSVGGQLNVGANQKPGDYSGTFAVTVTYQ